MKDVYEVLRQKQLEVSRLKTEVEALRIAVPLLLADGEAEDQNHPTLQRVGNDAAGKTRAPAWEERAKKG
jgi:hypothetical protein